MLIAFFVKLKYVPLRLLSDRRLRILFYVFFWFAVYGFRARLFCLLHYITVIASITTTRGGICVRCGRRRGLATIAARIAVTMAATTMFCTFSVVFFMRLFFND